MALKITWFGSGPFQLRLRTGEALILDPWTDGNPAYAVVYNFCIRRFLPAA